jgi:peptidoglycan/xylan/chitin deacetylase (PgdA/CDA1 family)
MVSRKVPAPRLEREPERRLDMTPARWLALGSLLAAVVATAVIVLTSAGGSDQHAPGVSAKPASAARRHRASGAPTIRMTAQAAVPILAYHVINQAPPGSPISSSLYVSPSEFSAQMEALRASGWHAVTLDELEANWTRGTALGTEKPIVLTFDDGYASHYTNALPILRRLGWVGVENLRLNGLTPSDGGLSDAQLRGLIAAGWELDSEGIEQSDLTTLDPLALGEQITTARQTLRSRYNVPADWLSYPGGHYNAAVIAAARAAGFLGALTGFPGAAGPRSDRFRMPRINVLAGTSPTQLLAQIASAKQAASAPPASS